MSSVCGRAPGGEKDAAVAVLPWGSFCDNAFLKGDELRFIMCSLCVAGITPVQGYLAYEKPRPP